jgi:hypothetical protein
MFTIAFLRRGEPAPESSMIGGKALEVADRNRGVELAPATYVFTGSGTDATTNGRKGIGFSGHVKRLIVATLCDKADVQTGIRTYRTCCLTGRAQILFTLTEPAPPALPRLVTLGYVPGVILSPGGLAWHLRGGASIGIEGLPVPFGRQCCERTAPRIRHGRRMALNCNGIRGAFLRADLAAYASSHLHRREHHPRAVCFLSWNGTQPLLDGANLPRSTGTRHIEAAYGTEIHTDTAVDTRPFVYLKAIGHVALLSNIVLFLSSATPRSPASDDGIVTI